MGSLFSGLHGQCSLLLSCPSWGSSHQLKKNSRTPYLAWKHELFSLLNDRRMEAGSCRGAWGPLFPVRGQEFKFCTTLWQKWSKGQSEHRMLRQSKPWLHIFTPLILVASEAGVWLLWLPCGTFLGSFMLESTCHALRRFLSPLQELPGKAGQAWAPD